MVGDGKSVRLRQRTTAFKHYDDDSPSANARTLKSLTDDGITVRIPRLSWLFFLSPPELAISDHDPQGNIGGDLARLKEESIHPKVVAHWNGQEKRRGFIEHLSERGGSLDPGFR